MVSLSDNSRHSGGYFFNDEHQSIQISDSDDLQQDHLTLATEEHEVKFRKIRTLWVVALQILLSIALVAASFVLPVLCVSEECGLDDFSLVLYLHAGVWFVFLLFDRVYRYQHNNSRLDGYLEFYRLTRNVRRMPFLIASGANVLLLVVSQILERYCVPSYHCTYLSKQNYVQIVVTLETAAILPFLVLYLSRIMKFNRSGARPDVSQDEMLTSLFQSQSQTSDIGFRDETYVDQVLEKQADMIRYLKQHNSQLGKRILVLTSENNTLKSQT